MIRIFLVAVRWAAVAMVITLVLGGGFLFTQYRNMDEFSRDIEIAYDAARINLYRWQVIERLEPREIRQVYQRSCYRQCHGEAVMLTTVLSPAGWIQVVERMRVKKGVDISGREADLIIQYLENEYPVVRSPYSYTVRKQTHDAVWRNDAGEGDIYADIIYATPEYLRSIGMAQQIEEYEVREYHVFIISLTVHEGVVPAYDMDAISSLVVDDFEEIQTAPPWSLRFETADRHHYEAMIRFPRMDRGEPKKRLTLRLKTIGGAPLREYTWDFPLNYPDEVEESRDEGGEL